MKNHNKKTLRLSKEIIRNLGIRDLRVVVGGLPPTRGACHTDGCLTKDSCPVIGPGNDATETCTCIQNSCDQTCGSC